MIAKIKKIPVEIIHKIAAGEVIDRPSAVIKELIENSLDAETNSIKIILEEAGLKKIIISDTGCGMSKADLKLAPLAHTSSKLNDDYNLLNIKTLGFRGEALACIAQVADLTIKSRVSNQDLGYEIKAISQNLTEIKPTARADGTTVLVENLFESAPVRKKYLHSLANELSQIIDLVMKFSLVNPQIRFFLSNNDRILLDLPRQSIDKRIKSIFGLNTFENLLKVNYQENNFHLSGFLAKPQSKLPVKFNQFFFVNKRLVKSKVFNQRLKETYQYLLPVSEPVKYFLNLSLPFERLDVNVHPQKTIIRFLDWRFLDEFVRQAVLKTFNRYHYPINNSILQDQIENVETASLGQDQLYNSVLPTFTHYRLSDHRAFKLAKQHLFNQIDQSLINEDGNQQILQLAKTYLIKIEKQAIIIIDQHAAHERILYEQLKKAYQAQTSQSVPLATAKLINLDQLEEKYYQENRDYFFRLGWEIKKTLTDVYQISKVPKLFISQNIVLIFRQVIQDLINAQEHESRQEHNFDQQMEKVIQYLACRGAVKAGDYLSFREREILIKKLKDCQLGNFCPHGRPTIIQIKLTDLAKSFGRQ